ncbi:kinase [Streptomyces bacillaris]|uniref:GHMP family kinase ATP-binding protein n=1 Tax=Streptomyces bacillaris TaxID=68179 RepID=UPI0035D88952
MSAPVAPLGAAPATAAGRAAVGTANGTFGELLQGALPGPGEAEGEGRFLVTLPVARWSTAQFELREPGSGLRVEPAGKSKARALAAALLKELGHPPVGVLSLTSSIPEGKGLASSSADLVATARAVLAVTGGRVPGRRLGELLTSIEPTDGVMYPGVVAFDHRRGVLLRKLGPLPALQVVAVDQGGLVDTLAFNHSAPDFTQDERRHYARLLDDLTWAVADGDLAGVGKVSTESAALNQSRMPNRNFAELREICREVSGVGLVACHSGTMMGIALDPRQDGYRAQQSLAVRLAGELPGRTHLYRTLGD